MFTLTAASRRLDAVAFSADGRELMAAGTAPGDSASRPPDSGVEVWTPGGDPAAPRRLFVGRRTGGIGYSADGRWRLVGLAATADPYGPMGLHVVPVAAADPGEPLADSRDFATAGDRLLTLARVGGRDGVVGRLACRRVTAAGPAVTVWAAEDEAPGERSYLALLPDGRAAVLAWYYGWEGTSLTLTLRAADTGRVLALVTPPGKTPGPLVASPDGERLALNAGGSLYVWRVAAPDAPPRKIVFGRKNCTGVGFLPDGRLLAAGNDGTVRRLDPDSGATAATYTFAAGKARSLAVAPDGLTAAVGTDRGTVAVFDLD